MSNTHELEIVWRNVIVLTLCHLLALHGFYYYVTLQIYVATLVWNLFVSQLANIGVVCGAHRLWTHRTYKAKKPLRIILMVLHTMANQNPLYIWARDHRVHHKFTDTDADPHNINRGFFFAHMGWLLCRKHPDVISKGSTVDMSDLLEDEVVVFDQKYFPILALTLCFIIPTLVPWYFWNDHLYVAFCSGTMVRYTLCLHGAWLVNSAAHRYGTKPYDGKISPVENLTVSYITNGEGFHNYHHIFPFDYKAAELDKYSGNLGTAFIDLMAKIGWAYDLRTATPGMIKHRKLKNEEKMLDFETVEVENRQLLFVQECTGPEPALRSM